MQNYLKLFTVYCKTPNYTKSQNRRKRIPFLQLQICLVRFFLVNVKDAFTTNILRMSTNSPYQILFPLVIPFLPLFTSKQRKRDHVSFRREVF